MKLISWCGDSLNRIREFPEMSRRKVGQQLNRLQHGNDPHDWKPMQGIGPGVCEIRVHLAGEHRVLFVSKFVEAVYDLDIAATRFRALVEIRKRLYP